MDSRNRWQLDNARTMARRPLESHIINRPRLFSSRLSVCLRNRSAATQSQSLMTVFVNRSIMSALFLAIPVSNDERPHSYYLRTPTCRRDGRMHCPPPPATYNPLNNSHTRSHIPPQWSTPTTNGTCTYNVWIEKPLEEECNGNLLKITSSDSSQVFSFRLVALKLDSSSPRELLHPHKVTAKVVRTIALSRMDAPQHDKWAAAA